MSFLINFPFSSPGSANACACFQRTAPMPHIAHKPILCQSLKRWANPLTMAMT
jgi:hypothetical protein